MRKQNVFKQASRLVLIILASLWMLFEDWVWDSIVAFMEVVGKLKAVNRFETFLARQNPYLLLALFVFPFFIMIPAKLYGLYLLTNGKVIRGVAIFVIAKGFITALLTRLFMISRDKLLQIKAFAAFFFWFRDKKEWLYSEVRKLPAWQTARAWIAQLKMKLRSLRREKP
jgi:hypothetical protein